MSLKDRVIEATTASPTAEDPTTSAEPTSDASATPAVAEPNDIAARDEQLAWLRSHGGYFADALPRHVDQAYFLANARAVLPSLRNCNNGSIMQALLACARFGLVPDGKHAAIIPFKQTATFVPMYQGYIDLMYRSGRIDSVHFGWIHEADQWDYIPSAPSPHDFVHRPRIELPKDARGPVILAYAFAWIKGGGRSQVIILNRWDAEAIRDEYSKAYRRAENTGRRDSAWHTDFEAMWAKSCVRRLEKVVPASPELVELVRADDAADAGQVPPIFHLPHESTSGDQPAPEQQNAHTTAQSAEEQQQEAPGAE